MTLAERFWGAGKSGPRIGQWREVVCVFTRLTNDGRVRKRKKLGMRAYLVRETTILVINYSKHNWLFIEKQDARDNMREIALTASSYFVLLHLTSSRDVYCFFYGFSLISSLKADWGPRVQSSRTRLKERKDL